MNTSQNTLSQVASNQADTLSNAIELLDKLSKAIISSELTPTVNFVNGKGETVSVTLPNLFSLDSEIKRLDNNVNSLLNISGTAYLQNSDGSFNKITSSKIDGTPKPIEALRLPSEFNRRNNWFFENFLSPLLYIDFDLSTLIDNTIKKISVKRLILNITTPELLDVFNSQLKGRNDLNYEETITFLNLQGISFFMDDDTYELNPSILKYEGSFGVVSNFEVFDENLKRTIKYYRLENVNYTDNTSTYKNTQVLKVGDVLILNQSTKFKVETLDVASRVVSLVRVSGKDNIPVGAVLSFESERYSNKKISVNVGYDEKQIIFVSPITELNVSTTIYSSGVCFNSNDLTLVNSQGSPVKLDEYYRKEVVDFGQHLLNLSKDRTIPTIFGQIPNPPVLSADSLKPIQINAGVIEKAFTDEIRDNLANKVRLKNEINGINDSISNLIIKKQTVTGQTLIDLEKQLTSLINQKNAKVSEYYAIVSLLSAKYKSQSIDDIKPKWRIRGHWGYPESVYDDRTGKQEVVQFKIYYRYLTLDGTSTQTSQTTYIDPQGNKYNGVFSNWNVVTTQPRQRVYDPTTQTFIWAKDIAEDSEAINSNQLDIPISRGESVEIKVQSVSEAGYPTNPLISDFSNSVIIPFPEQNNQDIDLYTLLEESAREEERAIIHKELAGYDFPRHFANNRFVDSSYYAHDAKELSFLNGGTTVSVHNTLLSLQDQITKLEAKLSGLTPTEFKSGKLKVYVKGVDSKGVETIYPVENGKIINLTPPTYYDRVKALPVIDRRGAIIKEQYTLVVENIGDAPLRFYSPYAGSIKKETPLPFMDGSNLIFNKTNMNQDIDYINNRRYDLVPIRYSSFIDNKTVELEYGKDHDFGFGTQQSRQTPGQFIYSRYKSPIGEVLYTDLGGPIRLEDFPNPPNSINRKDFIWTGGYNILKGTPIGNGLLNDFCVHTDHPFVKDSKLRKTSNVLYNLSNSKEENYLEHSLAFNIRVGIADSKKQNRVSKRVMSDNGYRYTKFGFLPNDRYLIGSNTTGMYFYFNPRTPEDIRVSGTDVTSERWLIPNESMEFPLNVEYRMTDYYDVLTKGESIIIGGVQGGTVGFNPPKTTITKQSLGIVGGYSSNIPAGDLSKFSYSKTLSLDLYTKELGVFNFGVNVTTSFGNSSAYINVDTTTI